MSGEHQSVIPFYRHLIEENARLREALAPFAADLESWNAYRSHLSYMDLENARAVLKGEEPPHPEMFEEIGDARRRG